MAISRNTILFTHPYYTALPDAVTHTMGQLVRRLNDDAVPVTVLCLADDDVASGDVHLWRVPRFGLPVQARWTRPILQIWFLIAAVALVVARRNELACVVTVDTPSGIGFAGLAAKLCSRGRTSHVCWVIDLVSDQVKELSYEGPYRMLHGVRAVLNDYPYRLCDMTVTLGECMRRRLVAKGAGDVLVIPQWQDRWEVAPYPSNEAKERFGLAGQTVILYSGNADIRHPLDGALEAAERLRNEGVLFLFVGVSDALRMLETRAQARGLENVRRWDPVPRRDLSSLLSAADAHLVSLASPATGTCVPSKAYSAMAVARPVIFLGDRESQVGIDVVAAGAGCVLDPSDVEGIVAAIRRFHEDPRVAVGEGHNGYEFFLEFRDLDRVAAAWTALVADLRRGSADDRVVADETLTPRRRAQTPTESG